MQLKLFRFVRNFGCEKGGLFFVLNVHLIQDDTTEMEQKSAFCSSMVIAKFNHMHM